jgi:NAD(P)-dependent dehydrogenase (short-subunit alcohol dehydrogenase family)
MSKLQGKVAVVTGGNSGIGLATARKFVEEGAYVFITGRRQAELEKAVKLIGKGVTAVRGDVSKAADVDRLYAAVKAEKGKVDVVVANAGIVQLVPLAEITDEHYDAVFNVNVRGLVYTVQKALPLFNKDGGSIILVGSIAGFKAMPAYSVYCASKAAVRSFARNWTLDLKDRKIRVNTLSPGPIDTPIMETQGLSREEVDRIKASVAAAIPMGRMGNAEELATAALFLASDDSSFVTGIDLCVDGGMGQI